jgi:serine/threonine-protein kinase RsbW
VTDKLHLRLTPEAASVTALLDALEAYAETQELPIKAASRLVLLADELAANVVMHAHGATFLTADVAMGGQGVTFTLTDDGPEYDPLGRGVPNTNGSLEERALGGLGVHFVEKLASSAHWRREGGHNILTITLDADAE